MLNIICHHLSHLQPSQSAFHRATWDILQVGQLASWEWQKVSLPSGFKCVFLQIASTNHRPYASNWCLFLSFLSFFLRLCSEVPLLEDTLMRILVIGLSRDLPLGPADAMELADHLVKRAAGVQSEGLWGSNSSVTVFWVSVFSVSLCTFCMLQFNEQPFFFIFKGSSPYLHLILSSQQNSFS